MAGAPLGIEPHARGPLITLERPRWRVSVARVALTGLAAGGILLLHGFHQPPLPAPLLRLVRDALGPVGFVHTLHLLQFALLAAYFASVAFRARVGRAPSAHERFDWVDWTLLVAVAGGALLALAGVSAGWALFEAGALLAFLLELWRLNVTLVRFFARPGATLPLSFLFLIAVGTLLIKLPVCLPPGHTLAWLDALFTITSAVCVTGLVVHNTATHFTPVGQAIIGVFIQLGGLGIIIFGSMIALLLGRAFSVRENLNLSQMMQNLPIHEVRRAVRFFVIATLAIELVGAAALFPLWDDPPDGPLSIERRAGLSLFHAVSAFCNAGFDITGNNLVPYRYALPTHAVIAPLIVIGGLGFPVLTNLLDVAIHRARQLGRHRRPDQLGPPDLARRRLSLHTKLVLTTTAGLYLYGVAAIGVSQAMPYAYEAMGQGQTAHVDRPGAMTLGDAGRLLADASFMSIAARTAGFNSMPMDEVRPGGTFTLMTLMFVGGSPGGTAGGVKTSVVAVLLLSVLATLRRRPETEAFGRAIADATVRRAGTLLFCYAALVVAGTLLLSFSEPFPFEKVAFEAVSAVTTTGLSLGVTADLTSFGKLVVIALMFLGRVGPLSLLGALALSGRPQRPYRYAHEEVALG